MRNPKDEPGSFLERLAVGAALTAFFLWLFGSVKKEEPVKRTTSSGAGMFRRARMIREQVAAGYETRDLSPRGIAAFGCVFIITMLVICVITTGIFSLLSGRPPVASVPPSSLQNAPAPTLPAAPALEAVPAQNYDQFLASERALLNSYGVDKNTGAIHIPIARAMEVIVSQNLPARPASEAQKFQDHGDAIPSDSSSGRVLERLYR